MANEYNYWLGGNTGNEYSYGTAANWSLAHVPLATENVVIPAGASYAIYGYDASAVELSSFKVDRGCTVQIGYGATGIPLTLDIVVTTGNTTIGGTGRTYLSGDLKTLNVVGGAKDVYVAPNASTLTAMNLTEQAKVFNEAAVTAATVADGSVLIHGVAGATTAILTTATVTGANSKIVYNSSGTITTANVLEGGTLDGSGDNRATTITTANLGGRGSSITNVDRFTFTNKIAPQDCGTITAE